MISNPHKIGEQFTFLVEDKNASGYVIYRSADGKYFNTVTRSFEKVENIADTNSPHYFTKLTNHPSGNSELKCSYITFLPRIPLDLVFETRDTEKKPITYERHTFGGYTEANKPPACIIFGTIYSPSGTPEVGVRIDASLNRSGYYIDKHPVISPATSAITDERGYFELPLLQGIHVTISIPTTGFTTSGYVPKQQSLELSGYCLSKEHL